VLQLNDLRRVNPPQRGRSQTNKKTTDEKLTSWVSTRVLASRPPQRNG